MYAGAICGEAAYGGKSAASADDAAPMLNATTNATSFMKFPLDVLGVPRKTCFSLPEPGMDL